MKININELKLVISIFWLPLSSMGQKDLGKGFVFFIDSCPSSLIYFSKSIIQDTNLHFNEYDLFYSKGGLKPLDLHLGINGENITISSYRFSDNFYNLLQKENVNDSLTSQQIQDFVESTTGNAYLIYNNISRDSFPTALLDLFKNGKLVATLGVEGLPYSIRDWPYFENVSQDLLMVLKFLER